MPMVDQPFLQCGNASSVLEVWNTLRKFQCYTPRWSSLMSSTFSLNMESVIDNFKTEGLSL